MTTTWNKVLETLGLALGLALFGRGAEGADKGALLIYGSAHSLDYGSQQWALRQKFTHEVNPLTEDSFRSGLLHTATLGSQLWIDSKLKGWKRWVFRGAVVGLHGYGAYRNIQAGQRGKR